MNPGPTITLSWDYLIELSDDGMQPNQPEGVIILPPTPQATEPPPAPDRPVVRRADEDGNG